jgi:D-arabinose 5-phosphate isomerase GutQ
MMKLKLRINKEKWKKKLELIHQTHDTSHEIKITLLKITWKKNSEIQSPINLISKNVIEIKKKKKIDWKKKSQMKGKKNQFFISFFFYN